MITKISLINCFDSTHKSILIRYCLSSSVFISDSEITISENTPLVSELTISELSVSDK
jgi:hypothetical protein